MGFEEYELLAITVVLVIVAGSYFASKLGIATPILLVLVGIGLSFIPAVPMIDPEPELILAVVLPPLLYSAAVNMPVIDFRRDIKSIGALSVVLVLVSAFGVGLLLWWIFPALSLAAAIAVGAVVSPPDAVAATSIGKKLGLPPRLLTMLEGEGLVNDATALVLLRTAVAATAGTFSFWGAVGDFAYAVVIAVIVGGIIGAISVWVRSHLRQPVLTTAISFAVPFVAYLPAEALNASGVIAVVVAGLVTGANSARRFTAQDRSAERTNWLTVQMLLENGVFLLMGLQLMTLIDDVENVGLSVWTAVWVGLVVTAVLGVIRVAFVVPLIFSSRRHQQRSQERVERIGDLVERMEGDERFTRHERIQRHVRKRHADARFYANEGLGWRGGAVLAWSGMRGVVTLAAAQSLPTDFPYRTQLILIAFVVAIVTLVGQGGTLPLLIRLLGIRDTDKEHEQRELTLLLQELNEVAAKQIVDNPGLRRPDGTHFDEAVLERARRWQERFGDGDQAAERNSQLQQMRELEAMILEAEHDALDEARSTGAYSSHTIAKAQQRIDSGAMRLEHD